MTDTMDPPAEPGPGPDLVEPGAVAVLDAPASEAGGAEPTPAPTAGRRRRGLVRRVAMAPRRVLVKLHRWVSFVLLAWLVVISITGFWLVFNDRYEGWLHSERYHHTDGDVGPAAALAAAMDGRPDGTTSYNVSLPRNGNGVYEVGLSIPDTAAPQPTDAELEAGAEAPVLYREVFVDPGSGRVNAVVDEEAGATN